MSKSKKIFECNSRRTFLILRFLVCSSAGANVVASFCAYGERLACVLLLYTESLPHKPSRIYIVKNYVNLNVRKTKPRLQCASMFTVHQLTKNFTPLVGMFCYLTSQQNQNKLCQLNIWHSVKVFPYWILRLFPQSIDTHTASGQIIYALV